MLSRHTELPWNPHEASMTHRLAHVNQLARQFQNKFCRKFIDDHEQEFLHNIEFLAALVS